MTFYFNGRVCLRFMHLSLTMILIISGCGHQTQQRPQGPKDQAQVWRHLFETSCKGKHLSFISRILNPGLIKKFTKYRLNLNFPSKWRLYCFTSIWRKFQGFLQRIIAMVFRCTIAPPLAKKSSIWREIFERQDSAKDFAMDSPNF